MKNILKVINSIIFILTNLKYFNFSNPKINKFLIVDTVTLDHLKKHILFDINFNKISTRVINSKAVRDNDKNSVYYLSLKIIFFFLKGLKKKLNFRTSYIYACINIIKPKVVLHHNHDYNFIYLAKIFPKIDFILLCHGSWYDINENGKKFEKTSMVHDLAKVNIDEIKNFYLIVNGNKDIDLFKEIGVDSNLKYLSFGSHEASYHAQKNYSKIVNNDILFISQIFKTFFTSNEKVHKQFLDNTAKSVKLLLRYCNERNLTLSYLCRENKKYDDEEINFIKSLDQNSKINILKNDEDKVWKEIYSSKIITTIDSTVGFDSISLKKKVFLMMMNLADCRKYQANSFFGDIKKIWQWTITNNDYFEFQKLLDDLIKISQLDYEIKTKDMRDYWFNNNSSNPSFLQIKNFLSQKINE